MVKLGKKAIFGIIAAAALAAGAILVLFRPEHVEEILPVVGIDTVRTRNVEIYGEFPGKIRAQQFVEVRARVEGYLEDMMFAEGTYVKKDQVLFIIDPKQYKAQVDRAEALVTKNKAIALKAERDLARIRPLYEQKAASQLDLDNAIAAYESAKADVQVSEANLTEARLALSYTTVRSPISGYISERHVDIGTLVGPGAQSLLANVVKSDTVLVEFKMTDLDYQKSKARNVNLGQKDTSRHWDPFVTITMADKTQYKYKGLVDFADPLVDAKSGTFSVRAEMPNPDRELLPGQFTNVRVLLDVRENAVAVPTKAITIEKSGSFIYVVKADASVEKRFIQTGPEVENATIVERGLNPNEIIVVEGQHKLSHGTKVKAL
ncbi:MAG: efflux RND transporter periplasmic adaptor subunit [Bacteroides sp.]|nr:efflux RND transporter periplasmic adaptor subunit [Bacteroidales bacterium]MDD6150271.1 efflux RND transporter periplasmic adaptor subunit [Bacteroides sp.]MDY2972703.1 efflux RND transporter periplasmic adaptor subunit [Candidatus Cryptobacteroides sp.]